MDAIAQGDRAERELQKRIAQAYSSALQRAVKQSSGFFEMVKAVESGKKKPNPYYDTPEKIAKWKQGFWRELLRQYKLEDNILRELKAAGGTAAELIRQQLPTIYRQNLQEGEELLKAGAAEAGMDISFAQINTEEIRQIISANETAFTKLAYRQMGQNEAIRHRLQNELAQACILGESQEKILKRVQAVTGQAVWQARRVAQTERNRVQSQARYQAGEEAAKMGVQVYNEWRCKFDNSRDTHMARHGKKVLQGQTFDNGMRFPGDPNGSAREVINCRCYLLPRVLLPGQTLTEDGQVVGTPAQQDSDVLLQPLEASSDPAYNGLLKELKNSGIQYRPVEKLSEARTPEGIIDALAGGDETKGSCKSLALAYIAQRQGWNVLDFRGGQSQGFFSSGSFAPKLTEAQGFVFCKGKGKSSVTVGKNLLKKIEFGKEYWLNVGQHCSIVRKITGPPMDFEEFKRRRDPVNLSAVFEWVREGMEAGYAEYVKKYPGWKYQYLELQSKDKNGWKDFELDPKVTLEKRFGCDTQRSTLEEMKDRLICIEDSNWNTDEFRSMMGYINTAENEQRKGEHGFEK